MAHKLQGVVVFHSMHTLFVLKRELARRGVEARAVPTPRQLSSDCGSALLVPVAELDTVRSVITEQELDIQGIHELED
jgi:hypothetical protein